MGYAIPYNLVKMNMHGQVTIPVSLRKKLHFDSGDHFELLLEGDTIKLIPCKVIESSQEWFWTKEWQEKEQAAEEDLKKNSYKKFTTMHDAIHHLKKLSKDK